MQTTSPVTPLMHLPPGGNRWLSSQGSLPALLSGSSPSGKMTCQRQQGKGMSAQHYYNSNRQGSLLVAMSPLGLRPEQDHLHNCALTYTKALLLTQG